MASTCCVLPCALSGQARRSRPRTLRVAASAALEPDSWSAAPLARRAALSAVSLFAGASLLGSPAADARSVTVSISGLSLSPCANPVAPGTPGTSTYKAKCYELRGTASNPASEVVRNADVYGQVIDAEGDSVLRSGRVGALQTLQPGDSPFSLQITAAASQPLPYKLKNFRAIGTTGVVTASGNPADTDFPSWE